MTLTYVSRTPETVDPNRKYPAIFLMHGMGSNEQDLIPLIEGLGKEVFVFSIRGPLSQPPGFAFFSIEGFGKPHREVFEAAMDKVEEFIDEVVVNHPIDPSAIFLMGFSQGAILSMSLGIKIHGRIKGIVALSGYIPSFVREENADVSLNGIDAFISHGEQDPVLPFEWGVEAEKFYKQHGASTNFKSYSAPHTVTMDNVHDLRSWLSERL
ncbi:alpha/beta hydrolase [Chungangia koreensis]|uniref:Alpha/beta hydrolase n=1 Tax=Chungangia koreensis TaxID=752657 RepID=A0ABV8X2V1_9LACT